MLLGGSYLPILHFAREKGIKLLGVNVDTEAIIKVNLCDPRKGYDYPPVSPWGP